MKSVRFCGALLLVFTILVVARPINAEATTQEMVSACRSITTENMANGEVLLKQDFDTGHCWGAFEVLNKMLGLTDAKTGKAILFPCQPDHHRAAQLIVIFVKYADKHPEKLADDYFESALDAIGEVFSCKNTP
jgi:hypothetical protein